MKFEEWWKKFVEDNPLWRISNENLNWRDAKAIAKNAYIEGMHHEFEKSLNAGSNK